MFYVIIFFFLVLVCKKNERNFIFRYKVKGKGRGKGDRVGERCVELKRGFKLFKLWYDFFFLSIGVFLEDIGV